jgi:hypothetical protein
MHHQEGAMTRVLLLSAGLALATSASFGSPPADDAKTSPPPADAIVLFNGRDLTGWVKRNGQPAEWKVENGYIEVVSGKGDIVTKDKFGPDFHLHVEFWLPKMPPEVKDQARANSGVYVQGRYEIQVLDMYENKTYANGSVGALYGILAPNQEAQKRAVKPPEQWNAFDITFHSPRVDDQGKVTKKGRMTVKLNGVALIEDGEFDKNTPGELDKQLGKAGPILLQDHQNKGGGPNVRYRNIWLKPLN